MADIEQKALAERWAVSLPRDKFEHVLSIVTPLHDQIEADGQRIAELEAVILGAADFLANAPLESNICCCGEPIEVHGYYSGHSPVDAAQYAAEQWVQQLRAALGDKG